MISYQTHRNGHYMIEKHRRYFLMIIICAVLLLQACGANDDKKEQQTSPETSINEATSKQQQKENIDKTPWSGEAQGHISNGDPATGNTAFLVHAGRINAALNRYSNAGFMHSNAVDDEEKNLAKAIATHSVNAETQSSYQLIEPVLKNNKAKAFKDELADLAKEETLSKLLDMSAENKDARKAVDKTVRMLLSRLQTSINTLKPSIHEVMLAASAILREAGDAMQKGLSAKGSILDRQEYEIGSSLIYSTSSIHPENRITYCEKSSNAIRDNRNKLDNLLDDITVYRGKNSKANAGDVYALAKEVEEMANSLPKNDEEICKK